MVVDPTYPIYLTEDQIRILVNVANDIDLEPLAVVAHEAAAWEALRHGLDKTLWNIIEGNVP